MPYSHSSTSSTLPFPCSAAPEWSFSSSFQSQTRRPYRSPWLLCSRLAGLYGTGTNNREVPRESSRDQFGCWRCALRHHVNTGIGDAHEQSRLCSERSHAGPKRALCVQSVRVPVATELLSPLRLRLSVILRLWTGLLRLWSKLLRLRTKLPMLPLKPLRGRKLKPLMSIALNSAADDDAMDWIAAN